MITVTSISSLFGPLAEPMLYADRSHNSFPLEPRGPQSWNFSPQGLAIVLFMLAVTPVRALSQDLRDNGFVTPDSVQARWQRLRIAKAKARWRAFKRGRRNSRAEPDYPSGSMTRFNTSGQTRTNRRRTLRAMCSGSMAHGRPSETERPMMGRWYSRSRTAWQSEVTFPHRRTPRKTSPSHRFRDSLRR